MATTAPLAALIWAGDERLARALLQITHDGLLRRPPHPLYRNGCYVYLARGERATTHSQKVLHHLQAVDFHALRSGNWGDMVCGHPGVVLGIQRGA